MSNAGTYVRSPRNVTDPSSARRTPQSAGNPVASAALVIRVAHRDGQTGHARPCREHPILTADRGVAGLHRAEAEVVRGRRLEARDGLGHRDELVGRARILVRGSRAIAVVSRYSNHQVVEPPRGWTRPLSVAPVSLTDVAGSVIPQADSPNARPQPSTNSERRTCFCACDAHAVSAKASRGSPSCSRVPELVVAVPTAGAKRGSPRRPGRWGGTVSLISGTPFGRVRCPMHCVAYTRPRGVSRRGGRVGTTAAPLRGPPSQAACRKRCRKRPR